MQTQREEQVGVSIFLLISFKILDITKVWDLLHKPHIFYRRFFNLSPMVKNILEIKVVVCLNFIKLLGLEVIEHDYLALEGLCMSFILAARIIMS